MSDGTTNPTTEVRRLWWVADDAIAALLDVAVALPYGPTRDAVRTRALRLREQLGPAVGERP